MQRLSPHDIKLPPEKIILPNPLPKENDLNDDLAKLSTLGFGVYGQLNEKLNQLQNECLSSSLPVQNAIKELLADEVAECSNFRNGIHDIKECLDEEAVVLRDLIKTQCDIMMVKIELIRKVISWPTRLAKFLELKKKEDKVSVTRCGNF